MLEGFKIQDISKESFECIASRWTLSCFVRLLCISIAVSDIPLHMGRIERITSVYRIAEDAFGPKHLILSQRSPCQILVWVIRDIDLTVEEPEQRLAVILPSGLARLHFRHSNPSQLRPTVCTCGMYLYTSSFPCAIVEPLA